MEKLNQAQEITSQKATTNTQTDFYYRLENKLKQVLTRNVERQFNLIFNKLSEKEKSFFKPLDPEVIFNINWNINVNALFNNRGDIFTSTLQKFFHSIFKELEDTEEPIQTDSDKIKDEFIKFKNTFIEIFNSNLIMSLGGENLETDDLNLNDYFGKFEIKNGFLNIFMKGEGKEIIEKIKEKFSREKKVSKEVQNENQFLVKEISNFNFN
jgi:hypothetical protein